MFFPFLSRDAMELSEEDLCTIVGGAWPCAPLLNTNSIVIIRNTAPIEIAAGIAGYFSLQRDGRHGSCSARNAAGSK